MRASFTHIESLVDDASAVPGDFAEVGVWRGDTFEPLCRYAHLYGKRCYAIDSFVGMGKPGPHDIGPDGKQHYPRGGLNAGGAEAIAKLRERCGTAAEVLVLLQGWVPEIFAAVPEDARFAFVHVDLDHYGPTRDALKFFWERMSPGGILCCHDWWPSRDFLASKAFNEFAQIVGVRPNGPTESHHGWLLRGK